MQLKSDNKMRFSVIDIGTNTILLLIVEYDTSSKKVKTIIDMQRIPRLGKGVDAERNILPVSFDKAIEILNEYKSISASHESEKIIATATSFIRDSKNKKEFLAAVKKSTGINIEILSGDDEAKWGFIGGAFDKAVSPGQNENLCMIDIGGGSTEISTGTIDKSIADSRVKGTSLDIGSVRLNEKYLNNHPPSFEALALAEEFTLTQMRKLESNLKGARLLGVAGTITTLAAIRHNLTEFDGSVVDGTILTLNEIENIFSRLAAMPLEELFAIGSYMEGRADIIIPGILILKTFMEKFAFGEITVCTKGLRYGIFLREVFKSHAK